MKFIKIIFNFIYTLSITTFISFAVIFLILFLSIYKNPKLYIIRSGSMSPYMPLGSVALVGQRLQPEIVSPFSQPLYSPGDVITYQLNKETVTHRIVNIKAENDVYSYQVQGDANKAADLSWVSEENIIGQVAFSLPEIGKYIVFAKSAKGNILLVIIPVTIFVYVEIQKIKNELVNLFRKKRLDIA